MKTMTREGHTFTMPGPYRTVSDIRKRNAEAGFYFFSPDTMRFFDSRIESGVIHGRLFVTSEQFHGSDGESDPRRYTVRCARDDGRIVTLGPRISESYTSKEAAVGMAYLLGDAP